MNNWLYSPTKLVGIAQMRSDGQWEDHILPEPIKIKEGNSIVMYQRSGRSYLGTKSHWESITSPSLKDAWTSYIIAKWTIKLK